MILPGHECVPEIDDEVGGGRHRHCLRHGIDFLRCALGRIGAAAPLRAQVRVRMHGKAKRTARRSVRMESTLAGRYEIRVAGVTILQAIEIPGIGNQALQFKDEWLIGLDGSEDYGVRCGFVARRIGAVFHIRIDGFGDQNADRDTRVGRSAQDDAAGKEPALGSDHAGRGAAERSIYAADGEDGGDGRRGIGRTGMTYTHGLTVGDRACAARVGAALDTVLTAGHADGSRSVDPGHGDRVRFDHAAGRHRESLAKTKGIRDRIGGGDRRRNRFATTASAASPQRQQESESDDR